MLLWPDPRVDEQPENLTTCFAVPIDSCEWEYLLGRCKQEQSNFMPFTILEGDEIYFMRSAGEDGYERVAILLRNNEDADECLESAAWIRVKHEFNGMIYICRKSTTADQWQSFAAIAATETDESLVAMVDLEHTENL